MLEAKCDARETGGMRRQESLVVTVGEVGTLDRIREVTSALLAEHGPAAGSD